MISTFLLLAGQSSSQLNYRDLAVEIEKRSKLPTLVVSCGAVSLDVDTAAENVGEMVEPLKRKGFLYSTSDMAMLREVTIPSVKLGILKGFLDLPAAPRVETESMPASAIKDDKIAFTSTKGKSLDLLTLGQLKLSKQIQVSPYFMSTRETAYVVGVAAKDGISGLEFSRALAKCLGGSFKITPKTWEVGFDADVWLQSFRRVHALALKGAAAGKQPGGSMPEDDGNMQYYRPGPSSAEPNTKEARTTALRVLGELVGMMGPKLISQTFEYPSTTTRINLNQVPSLRPALRAYLTAVSPNQNANSGTTVTRPGAAVPANILSRIDSRSPGSITIETNFKLSLDLNLVPVANPAANRNGVTVVDMPTEQVKIQML